MGLFDFLWRAKERELKASNPENSKESQDANVKLTYEISVRDPSDDELIFRGLHIEATRLDNAGDLPGAIEQLYKANQIERASGIDHGVKRSLRLPLFLQKAGRFDESIVEFHAVIDELPERVKRLSPSISENIKEAGLQSDLSIVYDKMRLACKREGKPSEAARYASISAEHDKKWEELQVIIESERKARSAAWRSRQRHH